MTIYTLHGSENFLKQDIFFGQRVHTKPCTKVITTQTTVPKQWVRQSSSKLTQFLWLRTSPTAFEQRQDCCSVHSSKLCLYYN